MINLAASFGEKFGLAFQYIDDCLDYSENSEKDKNLDIQNNQLTKVTYEYFKKYPDILKQIKDGQQNIKNVDFNTVDLEDAVKAVRAESELLLEDCKNILDQIFDKMGTPLKHPYRKIIFELCDELKTRNN